ncbi:MAG TPA: dTDP-glucose 4,6-dehydratase [Candidatus Limnocylindrales bacterium]
MTGGAGFIGSAYVRMILSRRDGTVVTVLDKLTYAGNRANLEPALEDKEMAPRLRFVRGDIADAAAVEPLVAEADVIVNFAAESHVDRSILDPEAFLRTGVLGVHVLLEALRRESERASSGERSRPRMLQVSTDEVYGSIEEGFADESAPISPRSPYAAAKAAGDLLVLSYWATFGLDVVITRGANTYGPHQHPEKFIPLFITNAIDSTPLPLYGDGLQRRSWLYVTDHAAAIDEVLRAGTGGTVYNIPGVDERTNLDVATRLLEALHRPASLIRSVTDRPGHDRRYAMDGARLAALDWRPTVAFEEGLEATVEWFVANEAWWRSVRTGEWDAYYARQYGGRLAPSNGG